MQHKRRKELLQRPDAEGKPRRPPHLTHKRKTSGRDAQLDSPDAPGKRTRQAPSSRAGALSTAEPDAHNFLTSLSSLPDRVGETEYTWKQVSHGGYENYYRYLAGHDAAQDAAAHTAQHRFTQLFIWNLTNRAESAKRAEGVRDLLKEFTCEIATRNDLDWSSAGATAPGKKPNPQNTKIDEDIRVLRAQIADINQELAGWDALGQSVRATLPPLKAVSGPTPAANLEELVESGLKAVNTTYARITLGAERKGETLEKSRLKVQSAHTDF